MKSFQRPDGSWRWSEKVREVWSGFQDAAADDPKVLKRGVVFPLLAMNKQKVPCAAAFYSEARMNDKNTFYLSGLIRNAGEDCRSGGAAILCYLIRNSKDVSGQFSPLRLNLPINEPTVKKYYEPFGCTTIPTKEKGRGFAFWKEKEDEEMACKDALPERCKQYNDQVLTADAYFGPEDFMAITSELFRLQEINR